MIVIDLNDGGEGVVDGVSCIDLSVEGANVVINQGKKPETLRGSDDLVREIPGAIAEILPTSTPPDKGVPPWIHPGSDSPTKNPTIPTIQ